MQTFHIVVSLENAYISNVRRDDNAAANKKRKAALIYLVEMSEPVTIKSWLKRKC